MAQESTETKDNVPDVPDVDSRAYDMIIYGATGFTGAIVAAEFVKRYATSDIDLKWAIAGRSSTKLTKLRDALQGEFKKQLDLLNKAVPMSNTPSYLNESQKASLSAKQQFMDSLPMLIADVSNESALRSVLIQTQLVISCVGPFRLFGENVVALCAQTGTHYVDICGEPDFMERCAFKYYEEAQSTGAIIVSACGFDSIPSDIGVSFIDDFYAENGGVCCSVNGYLTANAPDGYPCHHTTLKAAVHGLSEADKLRALRKEIDTKQYRVNRRQIPRNGPKQKVHKETYFWSNEVGKYSMLFPFADSAVVTNSQGITAALLRAQKAKQRTFPQYAAYISFNSYWNVMQAVSIGGISSMLVNYEFGRNLLMEYPSWMTWGVFSEEGPTEKQRLSQTFSFRFFAKGYSRTLCAKYGGDRDKLNLLKPDFTVKASVSGRDIGYSGTAKIVLESAITILEDKKMINAGDLEKGYPAVRGGVFTPSTVFANSSLVDRLNEAGITFVIEMEDDEEENEPNNPNDGKGSDDEEDVEVIPTPKGPSRGHKSTRKETTKGSTSMKGDEQK